MKKTIIAAISLILLSCGTSDSVNQNQTNDSQLKNEPEKVENWEYSESEDEMDGLKSFFAVTKSENTVEFKPPYNGGSTFDLVVQKSKNNKSEIYLKVSKGQFLVGVMDDRKVRVKIDESEPFNVGIYGTSDYRSDIMFIEIDKKIIGKIKAGKKLTVEPEFYQDGKVQVKFNIEGLKWDHE